MSLNKFTHIPLLKNDAKLKKVTNNHTKKSNHPKFFIKIKIMFQKKWHPIKIKINYHAQALKNQKKKKNRKKIKRGNVNAQEKKNDNWKHDCPKKKKRPTLLAPLLPPKKKKKGKKRGNVTAQWREKKEKKMQLKLRVFV